MKILVLLTFIILMSGCQKLGVSVPSIGSSSNGSSAVPQSRITVIQATASDKVGVTKVEFYVNNQLTCTVTAAPYNCSWNVPQGAGISYSLQTKAYNASGAMGPSQVVQVTSN